MLALLELDLEIFLFVIHLIIDYYPLFDFVKSDFSRADQIMPNSIHLSSIYSTFISYTLSKDFRNMGFFIKLTIFKIIYCSNERYYMDALHFYLYPYIYLQVVILSLHFQLLSLNSVKSADLLLKFQAFIFIYFLSYCFSQSKVQY
jgi:hypothetical protein